jgi:hypothetical protein
MECINHRVPVPLSLTSWLCQHPNDVTILSTVAGVVLRRTIILQDPGTELPICLPVYMCGRSVIDAQ